MHFLSLKEENFYITEKWLNEFVLACLYIPANADKLLYQTFGLVNTYYIKY